MVIEAGSHSAVSAHKYENMFIGIDICGYSCLQREGINKLDSGSKQILGETLTVMPRCLPQATLVVCLQNVPGYRVRWFNFNPPLHNEIDMLEIEKLVYRYSDMK